MRGRHVWALAAAAILAGCAQFPFGKSEPARVSPPEPPSEPAPVRADFSQESAEVAALLAYYQELLAMQPEELRREFQAVSQSFARERGELGRLRLALLMCVPTAPWRDDAKLLSLLDGALNRGMPPESPRRQFIVLLQRLVAERQREQRRADELQQKMDALLSIERSLHKRQAK